MDVFLILFSKACPAKEIERMRSGKEMDDGDGEKERGDFSKGVSIEGEFAFTKAVGEFCRRAVKEGRYRGN